MLVSTKFEIYQMPMLWPGPKFMTRIENSDSQRKEAWTYDLLPCQIEVLQILEAATAGMELSTCVRPDPTDQELSRILSGHC